MIVKLLAKSSSERLGQDGTVLHDKINEQKSQTFVTRFNLMG